MKLEPADREWVKEITRRLRAEWQMPYRQAYQRARDEVELYARDERRREREQRAAERRMAREKEAEQRRYERESKLAYQRTHQRLAKFFKQVKGAKDLSPRAKNTLANLAMWDDEFQLNVEKIRELGPAQFMRMPNCGRRTVAEIGKLVGEDW